MNWLYTLVFAGLMFSSGSEGPSPAVSAVNAAEPAAAQMLQGDEREKFEQSYPISPSGRVSVSNVNGPIVVEAWDRNEVKLEAIKIADTREALADVQIKVDSRADHFSVEADYDGWRRNGDKGWKNHKRLDVSFHLSVPRTAVLDEIEAVNGSVTVSNFVNVTKVSAVNGSVSAVNLRGTATLETVNGEVAADFDRIEAGSKISLSTVNGRASLTLPSDANATLKAESLNGEIRNDFGLPVRKGKYVGRDLYGRVGSGDAQVRLESVNGSLTVLRKNDGKQLNKATDLLPSKGKGDDDDWDDDTSSRPSDKVNREIARAIKDSAEASVVGVKIAQAELAKMAPEIEKIKLESLENVKIKGAEKIKIDKAKLESEVREGLSKQSEALSNIRRVRWPGTNPFIEKKSNTFRVKGTPKVSVEAKGCSVKVRGWDRDEVKYVLTQMDVRKRSPVSVGEQATPSAVDLRVANNEKASRDIYFSGDTDAVRIEVFVPRKADVKIVSNGEIRLDGVSGSIELEGVDEEIDVRNAEGKLKLSAADGQVRIIGFKGELDSNTGDADVYLEGNFSRVTGHGVDGKFIVTVPEGYDADVTSNVEALTVENMDAPTAVKEGQWRFGSGGPKLDFTLNDGEVRFRSSNTLTNPNSR